MLLMSPACTPQSIRMCWGPAPAFVGTVRRKKSPKPIRYIRTRSPPFALPPPFCEEPFGDFAARFAGLALLVAVLRLTALALRFTAFLLSIRFFLVFLVVL